MVRRIPRHVFVASSGWVSRGISAAIQIVSIPIMLNYLGTADYAIFAILTGLVMWFNVSGLGLGPTIQNHISELRVRGKPHHDFLRSVALFLAVLTLCEVVIFVAVAPFLQRILLRQFGHDTSPWLLSLVGVLYILAAVCGISEKIFFAEHRGYCGYLYQLAGRIVSLVALLCVVALGVGDRLLAVLCAWIIPQTCFSMIGFLHAMPLTGWWHDFSWQEVRALLSRSWRFAGIVICGTLVLGADYVIISQILRPDSIVTYNIFNKVFLLVGLFYSTLLAALWPVLTESFSRGGGRGKYRQVNRSVYKHIIAGLAFVLFSTLLVIIFRKDFIRILAQGTLPAVSVALIGLFGLYYALRIWGDTFSIVLQSRSKTAVLLVAMPIQAAANIAFMCFLGSRFDLMGVLAALSIGSLVTVTWVYPLAHYRTLKHG